MRRKRLIRIFKALFVSLILIIFVQQLFWGPWLRARTYIIEGNTASFPSHLLVDKKYHLLTLDKKEVAGDLRAFSPWIKEVEIMRQYPQTLKLRIKEYEPIAYGLKEEKRILLSPEGTVLPDRNEIVLPLVPVDCEISVSDGTLTNQGLLRGIELLPTLILETDTLPSRVVCLPDERYQITLPKTIVEYDKDIESAETSASLQLLFRQFRIEGTWPKRIDLRFDKPLLVMEEIPVSTESGTLVEQ